jgi:hypothetical protein
MDNSNGDHSHNDTCLSQPVVEYLMPLKSQLQYAMVFLLSTKCLILGHSMVSMLLRVIGVT